MMPKQYRYLIADPAGLRGQAGYVCWMSTGWGFTADHRDAHLFATEQEAKAVRRQLAAAGLLVLPIPHQEDNR